MRPLLPWLTLLALQLLWSLQWYSQVEHQQRAQVRDLAGLLGAEVLLGLESRPFQPGPLLNRLALMSELSGARLRGADNSTLFSQGKLADPISYPVNERGQHLASLDLSFRPSSPPLALSAGWVAGFGLLLLGWRRSRPDKPGRSLILEVDEQRRILRLSGHSQLLGAQGHGLLGQSLDDVLAGQRGGGRSLSELGGGLARRSLVVVRESQDLEKVRRRLKGLEEQYRSLCDNAHDLILVAEPEGTLVLANHALRAVAGPSARLDELFSTSSQEAVQKALHASLLGTPSGQFEAEVVGENVGGR